MSLPGLDDAQQRARDWFVSLRDRICLAFEAIEREADSDARFCFSSWEREDATGAAGGGGVRGLMKGKVFEKVGVNVSTVSGTFSPEFARTIHGATEEPAFFATGISLVAHMANPHVPAVHMNTRYLVTTRRWFGGCADLNPPIPCSEDSVDFHTTMKAACEAHASIADYPRFARWAQDYFFIPHRQVERGAGGIFYDHLEAADEAFESAFAFTRAVGEAFLAVYPRIVRHRMGNTFTSDEEHQMLAWRGRYAEFNLVYDRGTLFGLKTGGNPDAILMSLPPRAIWE
ncbi:coproporphyrinogen III oxidase [Sphingobium sp. LB126]|uniref:oxygen-dependent coproporphyrinogen oxidase n=1 Tax=Sphingobium sp. LB126 TaxID=1983755 RepID=UPI000C20F597|nr:oxygen-dependent coproporphyrinogen oxidase [Sphingobium sp. LB126]PJG47154.1 coproporphyrinogen III oxidase [Sphingobium sp. LB126]